MKEPFILIVMGSDSDLPVMAEAARILDLLDVGYHLTIVSAHRTPERLHEFGRDAEQKGFKVIIAGAGGAAHLPGMLASHSSLPVIGVPIQSKSLSGVDSLYSIVQMPPGIPVATMAINGAHNAGLMAVQMLAIKYPELGQRLTQYKKKLEQEVIQKAEKLESLEYQQYLTQMFPSSNG
jgi:5-(carboxyamino)imidazole ribonucleotide mutase